MSNTSGFKTSVGSVWLRTIGHPSCGMPGKGTTEPARRNRADQAGDIGRSTCGERSVERKRVKGKVVTGLRIPGERLLPVWVGSSAPASPTKSALQDRQSCT